MVNPRKTKKLMRYSGFILAGSVVSLVLTMTIALCRPIAVKLAIAQHPADMSDPAKFWFRFNGDTVLSVTHQKRSCSFGALIGIAHETFLQSSNQVRPWIPLSALAETWERASGLPSTERSDVIGPMGVFIAYGFPLPSMGYRIVAVRASPIGRVVDGFIAYPGWGQRTPTSENDLILPLLPLWSGVILNAGFWTVVSWCVWTSLKWVLRRRFLRSQPGSF